MAVFLSYSRRDEDVVKVLARGFDAAKRDIWFDHDLTGGEVWWDTILRNIRSSVVFLLAVSDHSLSSRACMAELEYAKALGLPILPVEVGRVGAPRSNVVAGLQTVFFAPEDAVSGFEVLAAASAAAERFVPLPDPLPPEPPIPFAYLQVIRRDVDQGELGHSQQLAAVDQLRRALSDETEVAVREEIVAILEVLEQKQWLSRGALLEVRAVLHVHRTLEAEHAGEVPPRPEADHMLYEDRDAEDTTDDAPAPPWRLPGTADHTRGGAGLDPSTAFLERIDNVYQQMQAGRFWQEGPQPPSFRPETAQPDPPTPSTLPPSYFAGVASSPAQGETPPEPVAADTTPADVPAARWPLSITALLIWVLSEAVVAVRLGVIALVLLVPGAMAVAAALSSHRVGVLGGKGQLGRAQRASRVARVCGTAASAILIMAVIAIFAAAGNLNAV